MAVVTIYRLAEECLKLILSGDEAAASNVSIEEVKLAIGQAVNKILKVEYMAVNTKTGETIPNGTVLAWFDDIEIESYGAGKSKATLPITPIALRRNMGVFGIYPKYTTNGVYELDQEFIPLQLGQSSLIKSQPMISDLLGQVGYEPLHGNVLIFNKDLKNLYPDVRLAARLAVMDVSQLDDYDVLPIPAEKEWDVKEMVLAMFRREGIGDKVVDATTKQNQNIPLKQQGQA